LSGVRDVTFGPDDIAVTGLARARRDVRAGIFAAIAASAVAWLDGHGDCALQRGLVRLVSLVCPEITVVASAEESEPPFWPQNFEALFPRMGAEKRGSGTHGSETSD